MAIATHVRWLKEGAEKWNARRAARHFTPSLRKAVLDGLDLSNANLRGAQLSGAKLRGTNLRGAVLKGADLTGADLTGADLRGVAANTAIFSKARLANADMSNAYFSEADFKHSDLSNADLRNSLVYSANLSYARLLAANIRSSASGYPVEINLTTTEGLTQRQIAAMDGDTGVVLPNGLNHPIHWPVWVSEVSEQQTEDDEGDKASISLGARKFLFISYSSLDRDRVSELHRIFQAENIPVWWDQDVAAGDSWRGEVSSKLQAATAVLTIWTAHSVESSAVVEEAASAQRHRKLVHLRLDNAPLPYGFSETQYADLRKWDGSPDHPEIRRLVQTIHDKLKPPSRDEIGERLIAAAPVAAIIEEGLLTAKDSPPHSKPPIQDPINLEARLVAQFALAKKALNALQTLDNNVGEAIRFDLAHFLDQVVSRPPSWYILSDSISDIRVHLDNEDVNWPGSSRNSIQLLCNNHEAMRPLLQPVQPAPSSADAPPPPDLNSDALSDAALTEVSEAASDVFNSDNAKEVLAEPAARAGEYLAVAVAEARDIHAPSEQANRHRTQKIRKALLGLAGLVGTAITSISYGVGTNLLTSPDAAKVFLGTLKRLFDSLLNLF